MLVEIKKAGVGGMAQWLSALTALPENLSSIPRTHVQSLITAGNFTFKESDSLFWPSQAPAYTHSRHTYTHKQICTVTAILEKYESQMRWGVCVTLLQRTSKGSRTSWNSERIKKH